MHRLRLFLLVMSGLAVLLGGGLWWQHTTRPAYRLRQGQEALRRGDLDDAQQIALSLGNDFHKDYAQLLWGEMLLRRGAYAEAVAAMNQIQDQGDLRLEAVALSGQCFLRLPNLREAERAFRFVVQKRPEHIAAHRGLADIYYHQGAQMLALGHLQKVAELDPRDGRPYQFMGHIYKDLPYDTDRAISCYQEALRRDLTDQAAAGVRQEAAELLIKRGRFGEALSLLEECRSASASSPKVEAMQAEALRAMGRAAAALAIADQAVQAHPRSPEVLRVRAKLHSAANEPQRAAAMFERALEVDKHDHLSRHQLALAYEALGRSQEAAEQRRLALQTQADLTTLTKLNEEAMHKPWDADIRRRLAVCCENLGKADLAVMWLQAAAAGDKDPISRDEAR